MREAFGGLSTDWKEGINWAAVRQWRLQRAHEAMKRHGLGALLLFYDENMRYVSSTLTPGWNRLKPGLRYVVLTEDSPPIVYEQGDIGFHLEVHNPWIPKENIRYSYAWIKGAAGPASRSQVEKFTKALMADLDAAGVRDRPLGVDFIDINLIGSFERAGVKWTDGMTAMMEARSVKSPDEIKAFSIVGSICDALHYEFTHFLKPGLTENEVAAFGFEYLYSIPGMEDVEDVIVSSGPNAWPNWRNFSDRIIRPGELVIIDLAALTWNGFKASRPTRCSRRTTRPTSGCGTRSRPSSRAPARPTSRPSGRRPRKSGATTRRTRRRRTCGATAWASPSTTRRSSHASGPWIIRSRSCLG
jgi:Xaa-Pro aminopeptidase